VSTADFTQLVTGRWLLCGGSSFSWAQPDTQGGIELLASGRFHLLTRDANGILRWGAGDANGGTWSVSGDTVQLVTDSGGNASFVPTFETSPRKMSAQPPQGAALVFAAVN
jgi:hypothetical protein